MPKDVIFDVPAHITSRNVTSYVYLIALGIHGQLRSKKYINKLKILKASREVNACKHSYVIP